MFETQVVEKIKIHLIFGNFSENCAAKKYCRNRQARNILRICNKYCFSWQQWLNERISMLHYMYMACLSFKSYPLVLFLVDKM